VVPLDGRGPVYQQIYRGLRGMVLDGAFASGARLPATRVLAGDLGVSRNIVLLAYRQLVHEGYAGGRSGSGTYVAPELPDMILKAPSQPPARVPSRHACPPSRSGSPLRRSRPGNPEDRATTFATGCRSQAGFRSCSGASWSPRRRASCRRRHSAMRPRKAARRCERRWPNISAHIEACAAVPIRSSSPTARSRPWMSFRAS